MPKNCTRKRHSARAQRVAPADSLGGAPEALAAAALLVAARSTPYQRQLTPRPSWTIQLGWLRWPALAGTASITAILVGVPLLCCLYKTGLVITRTPDGWTQHWSAAKSLSMIGNSPLRFGTEFGWSIGIGAAAATVAVIVGGMLAWGARRGSWSALPALLATTLALAVPGPLLGLGIIWLFNRPDAPGSSAEPIVELLHNLYDRSIAAPLLAQSIKALPLATLVLGHAARTVPDELLEGAMLDGASRSQLLARVILPLCWPAIAVAWLLALAVAVAELGATILVVPPGVLPLSVQIFGLIHYGVDDQVAGICLALWLLILCLTATTAWLWNINEHRRDRAIDHTDTI